MYAKKLAYGQFLDPVSFLLNYVEFIEGNN